MFEDVSKAGQLAVLLAVGTLVYYAVTVVYRLTLHPLAKYPGPFLAKVSSWYQFKQVASGSRHIQSLKEHQKYGDIVRVGPNHLSINTIGGLKEIYVSRKHKVRKSEFYLALGAPAGAHTTHSEIDLSKHAFRRRVLDHAFSDSAIRSAEDFIIANVQKWSTGLGDQGSTSTQKGEWSTPKDMSVWASYLGYDVMGDLAFGRSFDMINKDDKRYLPDTLINASALIYMIGWLPCMSLVLPILRSSRLMKMVPGKMARDNNAFLAYSGEQMETRIEAEKTASEKPRKDFAHYLIEAKDPETGKGFTRQQLHSESGLLIGAGSDTSSITMGAVFFYLVNSPDALAKATKEVRSVFSSVDDIRGNVALNSLPYLHGCIEEALRLSPPVPSYLPREVLPGGVIIDGEHIPAGTIVGTSAYAIHHNEEYFPDPFVFRPERWIADSMPGVTKESVEVAHAAFCAFSLGPRGCVGKRIAYLEITLALATILFNFDIRKAASGPQGGGDATRGPGRERKSEYQLYDCFIGERKGPMVEFKPSPVSATA